MIVAEKTSTGTKPGTHLSQRNYNTNPVGFPDEISNMQYGWELISPSKAGKYLETMNKNRSLRPNTVNKYKNDFLDDKFSICYDAPIIFNRDGEMINGQHRCKAALESGECFWCMVFRNVPNDAVIDKGLLRSTSDSLWMRGIIGDELKNKACVSIVNAYFNVKHPGMVHQLSENQIGEFLNAWSIQIITALKLSQTSASHGIAAKAGVQAALFAAIVDGFNINDLQKMMEVVNTGFANGESDRAAVVLRNQLLDLKTGGAVVIKYIEGVTEEAIKDYIKGFPRKQRYSGKTHTLIGKCIADIV